jgi:murein DD-endopeptidase MepM/ murein hydrolase activator NlpD
MPRLDVPSRSRALSRTWPRVAALALIAVAAAGCSDSARFDSRPSASNNRQAPQQEVTGSIAGRPSGSRVETQALPAPSRPATVASGGVAYGAQGLGAYRPGVQSADVTGSVPARPAPVPAGHWTWDGGSAVTVTQGETIDSIARKYGVPASAILEANGFANGATIRPGQRLVIPHYKAATAPANSPVAAAAPRADEIVHTVAPGESLIGIARHYGVPLSTVARSNNIQPYATVGIGERLMIPGGRHVASLSAPAPQLAPPRTTPPILSDPSVRTQNARLATPEVAGTDSVPKAAEAVGSLPSFRWPARGRVIAAFGAKINGAQNDGINLAVPEGTPIKAADDGVVAYAGNELKGYGNLVLVRHANGYVSAYANASELTVKRGDTVKRGQVIAHAGQTGNVTSPQLHFEIRKGSTPVDPMQFLNGA